MELGAEISQKIRSAIKAKLVDLGAYVDDELPDYIMVMVANKKNVSQMTADLNLFLGNNTEKFTIWLGGLLNKLQTITTESEKNEASKEAAQSKVIEAHAPNTSKGGHEPEIHINAEHDDRFEEEAPAPKKPKLEAAPDLEIVKIEPPDEELSKPAKDSQVRHTDQSDAGRKRKLTSVGTIVHRQPYQEEEEEEDEEYDPLNPAVGKVASVIRVTERKSSVPIERQANKNLLMKAMKEAQTSIERVKVVRPMRRSPSPNRSVRSRLGDRRSGLDRARPVRERSRDRNLRPGEERRTVTARPRDSDRRRRSVRESKDEPRTLEVYSKSRRNDSKKSSRRRRSEENYKSRSESDHNPDDVEVIDDRQVLRRSPIVLPSRKANKDRQHVDDSINLLDDSSPEEHFELSTLIEPGAEESEFTDEEEIESKYHSQRSNRMIHDSIHWKQNADRAQSPKFVVTLDGVDPEALKAEAEQTQVTPPAPNIVRVPPLRQQVQPITISLNGDDEEDGDGAENESPSGKKTKLAERCRFFPACTKGDQCPYQHPTSPCVNFPNCRFGNQCLYLHPVCKFDASCTRPYCIYSHTTLRKSPLPPPQPVPVLMPLKAVPFPTAPKHQKPKSPKEITCRFFPKCTNLNCPYNHPLPCKFGMSCSRKATCSFSHPPVPSKDKMRWTPATSQANAEEKAVSSPPASSVGGPNASSTPLLSTTADTTTT